jgi:DNA-binding MarR family transcriptional regulator
VARRQDQDPAAPAGLGSPTAAALRDVLIAANAVNLLVARRVGLSSGDLAALDYLMSAEHPMGPAELGHHLGMRTASATVLIDRLEAAGHVQRRPHLTDRRRLQLEVTEHARSASAAAVRDLIDDLDQLDAELSGTARDSVLDYLQHVRGVLRRYGDSTT